MRDYTLKQTAYEQSGHEGVALKALVRTGGDAVAVMFIMNDGSFVIWRNGHCLGNFKSPEAAYDELDKRDA